MQAEKDPRAVILMGVSGCGKTSVGRRLAERTGWPFFDGDDFHPQANIDKMARGIPLNDDDRMPWLERLHALITEHLDAGKSLLVASSALKRQYRDRLRGGSSNVIFVHLKGSFELIYSRMQARAGHYMKPEMLQSQFDALDPPADAIEISIEPPVDALVEEIIVRLGAG